MNKRDFLKGTAALAATPAIPLSIGTAGAAPAGAALAAAAPTPSYVYDSARRAMRFYRQDDGSRAMFAYFAAA